MGSEHHIMPSFNFMLLVDGGIEIPLKSVQPFSRENEYEPIQEGGMNDYVYLKRKPISQPFKLVVERYVDYTLTLADPLSNGTELLLPLLLFVGNNTGGAATYARYYTFTGAVVMGKQYGGLDAEKSGLLTETVTFGYNHMFCTNLPLSENLTDPAWRIDKSEGDTKRYSTRGFDAENNKMKQADLEKKAKLWKFNEKTPEGNKVTSHRTFTPVDKDGKPIDTKPQQRKYRFGLENNKKYKPADGEVSTKSAHTLPKSTGKEGEVEGEVELTRSQMVAKAKSYKWDKGSFTGNGVRQAKLNTEADEKRKKEMIEGAKSWEFKEKTKAGQGTQSAQNYLVTSHKELPDGSSVGLGVPEDPQETMAKKAVKGAKNTDNHTTGNKGIAPRKWKFDDKEPATKDGQGDRSRQNAIADENGKVTSGIGVSEVSKEKMAEASKKWAFAKDKYVKEGNKVQSAKKVEGLVEESKETLKGKAKKWGFNDKEKDGNGERSRQNAVSGGEGDDANTSGLGVTELDRDTMINGAHKWTITDKYTKEGGGVSSRKPPEVPEIKQSDMVDKAAHHTKNTDNGTTGNKGIEHRRWELDKKVKEGKGTASRKPAEPAEPSQTEVANKAVHGAKNTDNHTDGNTGIEPRKWSFDEKEPATKEGQGTASRVPAKPAESSRSDMAGKAVRHVKQSITDFLMG